jgi:hypothetical protein
VIENKHILHFAFTSSAGRGNGAEVKYTIMKRVTRYFFLAVLLGGFTSATPTKCNDMIKVSNSSKIEKNVIYNGASRQIVLDIHPLDILALRF